MSSATSLRKLALIWFTAVATGVRSARLPKLPRDEWQTPLANLRCMYITEERK